MAWQVDQQERRTFDPDQGDELLVDGSHADGVTEFCIVGSDGAIVFLAELDDLSDAEKLSLHQDDAIVWKVTSAVSLNDFDRTMIIEALKRHQLAHGFNPRAEVVLVRFGQGATELV